MQSQADGLKFVRHYHVHHWDRHRERKNLMYNLCRIDKKARITENLSKTTFYSVYKVSPNSATHRIVWYFKGVWVLSSQVIKKQAISVFMDCILKNKMCLCVVSVISETFTAVRLRLDHSRRVSISGLNGASLTPRYYRLSNVSCVLILLFTFIQAYCCSSMSVYGPPSLIALFFFLSVSFSLVVNTGKLSSIPHPPSDSNRKSCAPVVVLAL